jgi:hypothetical protein
MGITGLLPIIKPCMTTINMFRDLAGATALVDTSCFIYQLCGKDTIMDQITNDRNFSSLAMAFARMFSDLTKRGLDILLVFDGAPHLLKSATQKARETKAQEADAALSAFIAATSVPFTQAQQTQHDKLMRKTFRRSPECTAALIEICKTQRLPFIVAPFEADAQLVKLNEETSNSFIITIDSDIIIFGANRVVYPLKGTFDFVTGTCYLYDAVKFVSLPISTQLQSATSSRPVSAAVCSQPVASQFALNSDSDDDADNADDSLASLWQPIFYHFGILGFIYVAIFAGCDYLKPSCCGIKAAIHAVHQHVSTQQSPAVPIGNRLLRWRPDVRNRHRGVGGVAVEMAASMPGDGHGSVGDFVAEHWKDDAPSERGES